MKVEFLKKKCLFLTLDKTLLETCQDFSCDHSDLDDFFKNDAQDYHNQLLGKSYCFLLKEDPSIIVCAFTISNDSIKAHLLSNKSRNNVHKPIPRQKHLRSFPAVLIGRLGVNKNFKHRGIGSELMNFIKSWFIHKNNKTGCRFVVVDSYTLTEPIDYYLKNGFKYVFLTEEEERSYLKINSGDPLETRLMYYDLIYLSSDIVSN